MDCTLLDVCAVSSAAARAGLRGYTAPPDCCTRLSAPPLAHDPARDGLPHPDRLGEHRLLPLWPWLLACHGSKMDTDGAYFLRVLTCCVCCVSFAVPLCFLIVLCVVVFCCWCSMVCVLLLLLCLCLLCVVCFFSFGVLSCVQCFSFCCMLLVVFVLLSSDIVLFVFVVFHLCFLRIS